MNHKQIVERMQFINTADVYLRALIENHLHRYIYNLKANKCPAKDDGKLFYVCMELMPTFMGIYKADHINEEQCRYHLEWLVDEIEKILNHKPEDYYESKFFFLPGGFLTPDDIEFKAAGYEVVRRAHVNAVNAWDSKKIDYFIALQARMQPINEWDNTQYDTEEEILAAVADAHKSYETGRGYVG